jgi:predicted Zn-dependent protease
MAPLRVYIALLAALNVSAQEQKTGGGVNFYSKEKEAALGAQLAKEAGQKTTPLQGAGVGEYVERIGRQLALQLAGDLVYTFTVIASDTGGHIHEPLSLPAGYIFVPASLILTAQNEAEFAGMLAHAMAHAAERHATRVATRGKLVNGVSSPIVLAGPGGWTALGNGNGELAIPLAFRTILRSFETEADRLAVKMTSGAGYDPQALARYIGRTQAEDIQTSNLFSVLPARDRRMKDIEHAIQALPPKIYFNAATEEFPRIQDEVRRVQRPR